MINRRTRRNRKQNRRTRLTRLQQLESLESRELLAGDVHVAYSDGDLLITGDRYDNEIVVAATDTGVRVSGENNTRLNGSLRPIEFDASDGRIADDIIARLGRGDNQLTISGLSVGDDLRAYTGSGSDEISIEDVEVGDRIDLRPGSGDDRVTVGGDGRVARNVFIYASGGDNELGVTDASVDNDVYVRASSGDDVILAKNVETGDDLRLYGSLGDDTIAIIDSHVGDDTTLETGPKYAFFSFGAHDNDHALIQNSIHNDRADISLGKDGDFIAIREISVGGPVNLDAGAGVDVVSIDGSTFDGPVKADGGSGRDGLVATNSLFAADPDLRSFGGDVGDVDGKLDRLVAKLEAANLHAPELGTITDLVVADERFATLETAVITAELAGTLAGDGPFTVFAPTNAAFRALPDGKLDELLNNPDQLREVLLYHAAGEELLEDDVVATDHVATVLGPAFVVEVTADGVILNGNVKIIETNIEASNGVIHVLDAVLIPPASIAEIVVDDPQFSILETAVIDAGLAGTLGGDGEFTVFAPTDNAFNALPPGVLQDLVNDPTGVLRETLLYHTVEESLFASDVVRTTAITTAQGDKVVVEVTPEGVFLNKNVRISTTNIPASNGVIHVLDAVLTLPQTISEIVIDGDQFTTLETALTAANLVDTLNQGGPFTVFAPTDDAFAKIPADQLDALLATPAGDLTKILTYHVVTDELFAKDVVELNTIPTFQGSDISVDVRSTGVFLNGDTLIEVTNIVAANGVVHVIDTVLMPPMDASQSIAEIVETNDDFETLRAALDATGLTDTLNSEGTFTVFAPTDDAFAKLPSGTVTILVNFLPNLLEQILKYHVSDTIYSSDELKDMRRVDTLIDRDVSVTVRGDDIYLNRNVLVQVEDIQATNGVVHVIDTVLLPL